MESFTDHFHATMYKMAAIWALVYLQAQVQNQY